MNRRVLIILLSALVLSVCASYLVYRAVTVRGNTGEPQTTAQLVVAAHDLAAGSLIREADVTTQAWPGAVPKGASLKRGEFLNRGVVSPIYQGEPLTENRLSPKGSGGGLAATIPPGMRACAVKVNEVVGVAGFVVPGMRVDVLITGLPPGGTTTEGPRVRTLLQNIQVLSAGTDFQKDQEGKPQPAQVVNLLVTPGDAEILSLASNETRIQLVLRNPMDTEIRKQPGSAMSALFGDAAVLEKAPREKASPGPPPQAAATVKASVAPKPVVPVSPEPRTFTIEMSNGSVHTQARFNRPLGEQ